MRFMNGRGRLWMISLIMMFMSVNSFAQQFAKVKVILKNGVTLTGQNGSIENETFMFTWEGKKKAYTLKEIQLIMAKQGSAGNWAACSGGGCAGLCLLTIIASSGDSSIDTGEFALGSLIWTGIFAAGGYVLGLLVDNWQTVYISPGQSSSLGAMHFGMGFTRKGGVAVGLSYRF